MRTIIKITGKQEKAPVFATTMTIFEHSVICLFGGIVVFNGPISDIDSIELTIVEHVDFNWVDNIDPKINYNSKAFDDEL